jgi:hypothetical protein
MTDKAGHDVTAALATAADADYEVEQGISFVGLNALIMLRYMHEYGWKHGDFAPFSINSHANAMHNSAPACKRITTERTKNLHGGHPDQPFGRFADRGRGRCGVIVRRRSSPRSWPPTGGDFRLRLRNRTVASFSQGSPVHLGCACSAWRCYEIAGIGPMTSMCSSCTAFPS